MSIEQKIKSAPKRLSVGGCLLICIGVPAVLMLVGCLGLLTWRVGSGRRVDAMLAEIQARGEPISAADLEKYYALPEGTTDVTDLWLSALTPLDGDTFRQDAGQLPIVGTSEIEIPPPGEPWAQLEDVEALLAKYSDTMQRLHEAADKGGAARYDLDFGQGFAMLLEHVQSLRSGARMLSLEAHVRAHRGDAHGAADSIHAASVLGSSLEQEPVIISQLVRIAVYGISSDLCRSLLPHVEFSDEDLHRMSDDFRTTRFNGGFRRSLTGERVMGIQGIKNPAADTVVGQELPPVAGPMLSLNSSDDLAQYLIFTERMIEAAEKPIPQAQKEFDLIEKDLRALAGTPVKKFRYVLTLLLLPATGAALDAAARGNATNDAAVTAIAIERYRRKHGQIPDELAQLVPEFLPQVPIDPFDGKPLRYVVRDDEYLLYCVGRDGVDDGGEGEFDPDIVFRVERP